MKRDRTEILPLPEKRGLNREQAADYIDVGTTKFDEMVADGRMPGPVHIDGRRIWDRIALDRAFDRLPGQTETDKPSYWDKVLK